MSDFSDATLILVGHGSTLNAESSAPTYQHADTLRARKIFHSVQECFWKLEPGRGGEAVQLYFDRLDQVRQAVNRSLYLGLEDLESHFAVYPRGAFYKKHLDRFRNDDARTLTAVLYLNQDWPEDAGGEMRLYLDDTCVRHLDVRPEAGTLVLFLSDRFWHEVLPAGHQRLSVTGWFRRRLGDLSW